MRRRPLLGVLALVAVVGGGATLAWLELTRDGPALRGPVTYTVEHGKTFSDVTRDLHTRGLVRRPLLLRAWARITGRDRQLQAGEFTIPGPLSARALLDLLTTKPAPRPITIPEGLTVREVVRLLANAGFGSEESFECLLGDPEFLASEGLPAEGTEGYLFPDTYDFALAMSQERILRTMIRRFGDVWTDALRARATALGLSSHQAVTLASLVEEEAKRPEERRLIAAVFVNRLRRGMPLQSDPTVLYGRTTDDRSITRDDLRRATPYNTYTIPGLPPTPISNPGRAALEAAVDPAPVGYLYFVARGDGSHEFSTTLAQHNAAVARARQRSR